MSGFRKTGIHPLNPGYIKDRETAPCLAWQACYHDPVSSTSDADTSERLNSLEICVPASDSQSPKSGSVDSISSAMDTLLIQPHISFKSKRKAKPGYNSSAADCLKNQKRKGKKSNKRMPQERT